jgi:hypothetical protein
MVSAAALVSVISVACPLPRCYCLTSISCLQTAVHGLQICWQQLHARPCVVHNIGMSRPLSQCRFAGSSYVPGPVLSKHSRSLDLSRSCTAAARHGERCSTGICRLTQSYVICQACYCCNICLLPADAGTSFGWSGLFALYGVQLCWQQHTCFVCAFCMCFLYVLSSHAAAAVAADADAPVCCVASWMVFPQLRGCSAVAGRQGLL